MKRLLSIIIVLVFAISFTACIAVAGVMGGKGITVEGVMGGKGKKKSEFDSETAIKKFRDSLFGATKLTIEAVEAIYTAVGKKEEAVKMGQLLKDFAQAKKKNDVDAMKKIFAQINNATASIERINLMKEAEGKEAKKYMGTSLLKTGVAVWLDKKGFDYAKLLVEKLPNEISSNPMKALKLKPVLGLAKMAVSELPTQIKNVGAIGKMVGEYATKKGLPAPSPAEKRDLIKKEAPSVSDETTDDL